MRLANRLLILLVAAELLYGAVAAGRRLARPAPPEPDWSLLDTDTAADLRGAAAAARRSHGAEDWRQLGSLYMASGLFTESEMCSRVACRLEPNDAFMARQWAFSLERLARLDAANDQYRRASALHPDVADANTYFVGRNLLRLEKPEEARAVFATGPNLESNRYELARRHLRAGQLAEAESLYQGLLTERPNALQVHLLGYRLSVERGDARQAFTRGDDARYAPGILASPFDYESSRVIQLTLSLGPAHRMKEGGRLLTQGRLDEAHAAAVEGKRIHPRAGFNDLLAEVEFRRGQFQEAIKYLEEWEVQDGPSARAALRLGDAWEAMGQSAKAREQWLRAARIEAGVRLKDVHEKLSQSFSAAGDKASADGHLARSLYYRGREQLKLGDPKKAQESFATAVRHDPTLAQAWFYLAEVRRRSGETGPAAEAYRACLKLNPDHGRALAALAWLESPAGE